jgi:hypothetical protein
VENLLEVDDVGPQGFFEKQIESQIEELGFLLGETPALESANE